MVYDSKTLKNLHDLTKSGEIQYQKMLEEKGNEIIFKHEHPLKWIMLKIYDFFV